MASSQITYRTTFTKSQKFNGSRFVDNPTSGQEKNRISIIRKIIMISSIKKEVKKILLKLMDQGI